MRPNLVRMLVALVMILMVPLQGIAGVTAGLCMALGHHEAAASVHGHESDHGNGAAQHHSDDSAAQDDKASDSENPAGSPHCPPCVACCAAAAISSFSPVFIPEGSAAPVIASIPPSFFGIQPETLDRPPLAL